MDSEKADQVDVYYTPPRLIDKLSEISATDDVSMYELVNPPFATEICERSNR